MSDETRTCVVRALIADDDGRLLLASDVEGRRLPSVEVNGNGDDLPAIRAALRDRTGVDTVFLRSIERHSDDDGRVLSVAIELQPRSGAEPNPGAIWQHATEVDAARLPETDRSLVARYAAEAPSPLRVVWASRGWFAEACQWIERTVAERGGTIVSPVEQLSGWCISSVLRAETDRGRVYFKATAPSPLFVDEGSVTACLAALFPGRVPRPLAVDRERRWMLLDDFGPVVGWGAEPDTKLEVVSAIAELHVRACGLHEELLAAGVLDRRADWLAPQVEMIARDGRAFGLDDAEAGRLASLATRFADDCFRLADAPVPDSLVHGDLHLANVAGERGRFLVFDWTDACLAHPFLDLLVVLLEEDRTSRDALRDTYLMAWEHVASRDELLGLWRMAEPLACLNQAVSYRSIVDNVEPGSRADLEGMDAYWVRKALDAAEAST